MISSYDSRPFHKRVPPEHTLGFAIVFVLFIIAFVKFLLGLLWFQIVIVQNNIQVFCDLPEGAHGSFGKTPWSNRVDVWARHKYQMVDPLDVDVDVDVVISDISSGPFYRFFFNFSQKKN